MEIIIHQAILHVLDMNGDSYRLKATMQNKA